MTLSCSAKTQYFSWTGYNRYVGCTHCSPLVASIAETGDMVGGLLREGNSGNAAQADQWIPGLVERIRQTAGAQVRVRFNARLEGRRPTCVNGAMSFTTRPKAIWAS
ncbi:MAG: hypothetical protein GXZ05_02000 [Gammaproteobacteria bacterium]|nr:hypothetical protein [Gammaproteobacteria bacterium]